MTTIVTQRYRIERADCRAIVEATAREIVMIEAARLAWTTDAGFPDNVEIAAVKFGGVSFLVCRETETRQEGP